MHFQFVLLFLSVIGIGLGERIYSPTGSRRTPPQPPSYAAAVNPNRATNKVTTPSPSRQREFLPQNITFVLSARGLKSKSVDPSIKVFSVSKNGTMEKLGKTATQDNNADPNFLEVFSLIWKKGTGQKLKLDVRDAGTFSKTPLGSVLVDLDEFVDKGESGIYPIQNGTGNVIVQKTVPVKFRLYARGLAKADLTGHSDPYVESYWSLGEKGKQTLFAKSSVLDNTENPDWNDSFEFPNYIKGADQWWTFKVFDSDPTGKDDLGEAKIKVDSFASTRKTKMLRLIGGKKTSGMPKLALTPA